MSDRDLRFEGLCTALDAVGLLYRGGFHPTTDDNVPSGTATLILVGNAGQAMWHAFQKECGSGKDPLNEWTRRVLSDIAKRFLATTIFPFDGPPYAPFFAWARRAEAVADSPIGMLIHSEFGLWHAWRGALAFQEKFVLRDCHPVTSPCYTCSEKPCQTACPVDAFRGGLYDVVACASHLRTEAGADCMAQGGRARRACPVGSDLVYAPAQARFHMNAFLRNQPL